MNGKTVYYRNDINIFDNADNALCEFGFGQRNNSVLLGKTIEYIYRREQYNIYSVKIRMNKNKIRTFYIDDCFNSGYYIDKYDKIHYYGWFFGEFNPDEHRNNYCIFDYGANIYAHEDSKDAIYDDEKLGYSIVNSVLSNFFGNSEGAEITYQNGIYTLLYIGDRDICMEQAKTEDELIENILHKYKPKSNEELKYCVHNDLDFYKPF